MATSRIGFIGVGIMGGPMAANMAKAGFDVRGWARRFSAAQAIAGITPVEDARDLAGCDVLVSMLPDLPQLREVLDGGLLDAIDHPATLVICSTSSPSGVRDLADELAPRGIAVVDAPVSGGERKAIDGTLAIMVGGTDADVAAVRPVLEACGTPVHLGPLGAGEVAKACNQMIVAATTTALVEAAVLAERSGLDVGALFALLGTGLAGSEVMTQKAPKLVAHDHTVSGPAKFLIKDLGFALEQAATAGVRLDLAALLRETYSAMTAAGYGDLDTTALQAYVEGLPVGDSPGA